MRAAEALEAMRRFAFADLADVQTRKRRAIGAHRSALTDMISDHPSGFRLSKADLRRFSGAFESFMASAE